jgi:hypothetical protein
MTRIAHKGEPPKFPSSKKPKKGVRHPGSAKGVEEADPKKQEKTALKEGKKSGQKMATAAKVEIMSGKKKKR